MPGKTINRVLLCGCLAAATVPRPVEAGELAVSAGRFGGSVGGENFLSLFELGIEYRSTRDRRWGWRTQGGLSGNELGGVWAYGGLRRPFGSRWRFTPSFSLAVYEAGGGRDLGSVLHFRTAIELGRRFGSRGELSIQGYHLSNANTGTTNPGSNSLVLTYAFSPGERKAAGGSP